MHFLIKILAATGLALGLSQAASAQVQSFQPSFPQFSQPLENRQQDHKIKALGQATFANNIKVPMYGVTAPNPYGEGLSQSFDQCRASTCRFDFKLTEAQAKQLKLLLLASGDSVLVPRTWHNIETMLAANGSSSTLLLSPDAKQAIRLSDTAACVGCGLSEGTLYFPRLVEESLSYDFGATIDPQKRMTLVHPSKNVSFFSYKMPPMNYTTHGVAKYNDNEVNLQYIHITLSPENEALARPILNFYNATH